MDNPVQKRRKHAHGFVAINEAPEPIKDRHSISSVFSKSRNLPNIPRPIAGSPQKSKWKTYKTIIDGEETIFSAQDPGILPYLVRDDANTKCGTVGGDGRQVSSLQLPSPPTTTRKKSDSANLSARWRTEKSFTQQIQGLKSTTESGLNLDVGISLASMNRLNAFRFDGGALTEYTPNLFACEDQMPDQSGCIDKVSLAMNTRDVKGRLYDAHSEAIYAEEMDDNYLSASEDLKEDLMEIEQKFVLQNNLSTSKGLPDIRIPLAERDEILPLQDSSANVPYIQGPGRASSYQQKGTLDYSREPVNVSTPLTITDTKFCKSSKEKKALGRLPLVPTPKRPKPFVRPPFPARLCDRSLITAATSSCVMRTCFRIGEAIRAGSEALRSGVEAVIELYARVTYSSRDMNSGKQYFQFADLFHEHPPFLNGIHSTWKGKSLWDKECLAFLSPNATGKLARIVGRLKWHKDVIQEKSGWSLTVLSIWETDWDDVEYLKEIVCFDVCSN